MVAFNITLSNTLNVMRTIIDLALVWYILYLVVSMFRQNMRTQQLFKGVLFILILKLITNILGLTTMDYVVNLVLQNGIIAVIIIFQPEIRALLETMGRTKLDDSLREVTDDDKERYVDEIVDAVMEFSKDQVGALITFERKQSMMDYIKTGTRINADIKSELLGTIFWEGTPLHDGAVIIQKNRIVCAAAFYPPTEQELSPLYGARHRAALGISEITDSLTIVVSEETGTISFATNGKLRKIPRKELKVSLINELDWFKESDGDKNG